MAKDRVRLFGLHPTRGVTFSQWNGSGNPGADKIYIQTEDNLSFPKGSRYGYIEDPQVPEGTTFQLQVDGSTDYAFVIIVSGGSMGDEKAAPKRFRAAVVTVNVGSVSQWVAPARDTFEEALKDAKAAVQAGTYNSVSVLHEEACVSLKREVSTVDFRE